MGWPGPITHRQYLAWMGYLRERDRNPSPDQWYMMAIAAEVRRTISKNPNQVQPSDCRLELREAKEASSSSQETGADGPPEGYTGYWPKRLTKDDITRYRTNEAKRQHRRQFDHG